MAIIRVLLAVAVIFALVNVSEAKRGSRRVVPESNRATGSFEKASVSERDYWDSYNYPILEADSILIYEDEPIWCVDVLLNDRDYEHQLDNTTFEILELPSNGYAFAYDQSIACYTPNKDFNGYDEFKYKVCDIFYLCHWAVVRVWVEPVNDKPLTRDDSATVGEDQYSIIIDVLENDEDVDGAFVDYRSLKVVQQPCNGVVSITRDFHISYTPDWNEKERFYGDDYFVYQVCDNIDPALCSESKVIIDVLDKCIACEKCANPLEGFNLHRAWLHRFYHEDVLV